MLLPDSGLGVENPRGPASRRTSSSDRGHLRGRTQRAAPPRLAASLQRFHPPFLPMSDPHYGITGGYGRRTPQNGSLSLGWEWTPRSAGPFGPILAPKFDWRFLGVRLRRETPGTPPPPDLDPHPYPLSGSPLPAPEDFGSAEPCVRSLAQILLPLRVLRRVFFFNFLPTPPLPPDHQAQHSTSTISVTVKEVCLLTAPGGS